jgi:hypothetical protein
VTDDRGSLTNIKSVLAGDGRAIILVPQGPWNFGTLDEALGHRRRYTPETLGALAKECGLEIISLNEFNRVGTVAWYLNGRIFKRRSFGIGQIWILNSITPIMRRLDRWLPIPPLSLIAIMQRPAASQAAAAAAASAPIQASS